MPSPLELAGFATGLVCVLLATRVSVWTFPVGIANSAIFLVLFLDAGIPANAGLQIVFLVLSALGWWWWLRGRRDDGTIDVRPTPRRVWGVGLVVTVVVAAGIWAVLTATNASALPLADAATTATSLFAQLMLNRRWVGTWIVWIVTDVALVAVYAAVGLWLTAGLYVVFTGLAISGLITWRRLLAARVPSVTTPPSPSAVAGTQR